VLLYLSGLRWHGLPDSQKSRGTARNSRFYRCQIALGAPQGEPRKQASPNPPRPGLFQIRTNRHATKSAFFNTEGGKGVIVPGCVYCKKLLYTGYQYLSHLALDVLPQILERVVQTTTEFFIHLSRSRSTPEVRQSVRAIRGVSSRLDFLYRTIRCPSPT
jgi:hypothetical protein